MKTHFILIALALTFAGCTTCPTKCRTTCCPIPTGGISVGENRDPQKPKPSGISGSWSGYSYGESISIRFGANGSAILTNSAGANSGSWSSQGAGSFSVNIAGQSGRLVLVNSSTASLTIGGSSIELKKN